MSNPNGTEITSPIKSSKSSDSISELDSFSGIILSFCKSEVYDFFENVIVNDNDETIKKNRLELLSMLCKSFDNYFNFSKIEV